MRKKENILELPLINLKSAKKEQGEKAYVISLLRNAIDICNNNITNTIQGKMLLKQEYFGEIYNELMSISKDEKWFWEVKSREFDQSNKDNFIYDIFINSLNAKVENSEYYKLNYIERSLIFLELDTLAARAVNFNEIRTVHWKSMRSGFVVVLFNIINGVANKEINKVLLRIREDGIIINCTFSYGRPLVVKDKFNPEKICEQMFFYRFWRGQLYSLENKLIKESIDYTTLCDDFDLNLKIDGMEEKSLVRLDENYVDILNSGVALKHLGKYEDAKEMYIKAIHLDNTHPNGYYNLGKILYILGDYKASAKAYKASFERGICELQQSMKVGHTRLDTSSLYVHLGHALLDEQNKEGQYSEYIKKYEEGLDPRRVNNYKINRGQIRANTYNEYDKICVESAKAYLEV